MRLNRSAIIVIVVGLAFVGLLFIPIQPKDKLDLEFKKEGTVVIEDSTGIQRVQLDVEIADTPEKQEQGLTFRTSMEPDQGLLMIMEEEEVTNLWMLDIYLALDIIYVDTLREVVFIAKGTEPEAQEPVTSQAPSLYILEVNAGIADRHGIQVGDRMRYERLRE